MQGLEVRLARSINQLISRAGKVWCDRYYARDLTSPRAAKHAIQYVLNNFRKHGERVRGDRDPCASAVYDVRRSAGHEHVPISAAKTWLGRYG